MGSTKTKVVAFRLPNDVYSHIEQMVEKQKPAPASVGSWCLKTIIRQAMRKHGKNFHFAEPKQSIDNNTFFAI